MPVPGNDGVAETVVTDEQASEPAEKETVPAVDAELNVQVDARAEEVREQPKDPVKVAVSVENWVFRPSMLRFKKGQAATVTLTGVSGVHSFAVVDLGINQSINAGQSVSVTIPTDRTGTFAFRCAVPCGPGHREMIGEIIIEE